jgi:hypothetical protein
MKINELDAFGFEYSPMIHRPVPNVPASHHIAYIKALEQAIPKAHQAFIDADWDGYVEYAVHHKPDILIEQGGEYITKYNYKRFITKSTLP